MRLLRIISFFSLLLATLPAFSQWKNYRLINDGMDTINRVDQQGRKQGPWLIRYETVRGEPGYEEEGEFVDDRKEGEWRLYNLMGDFIGLENYRWGLKDGICRYFTIAGQLRLEQQWKALNPDKVYDTIMVEDLDRLDSYRQVVVKNEGAALKHGTWKYYDAETGVLLRSETYTLGKLEQHDQAVVEEPAERAKVPKPKEVLEFESRKRKIRYQDGSTY